MAGSWKPPGSCVLKAGWLEGSWILPKSNHQPTPTMPLRHHFPWCCISTVLENLQGGMRDMRAPTGATVHLSSASASHTLTRCKEDACPCISANRARQVCDRAGVACVRTAQAGSSKAKAVKPATRPNAGPGAEGSNDFLTCSLQTSYWPETRLNHQEQN